MQDRPGNKIVASKRKLSEVFATLPSREASAVSADPKRLRTLTTQEQLQKSQADCEMLKQQNRDLAVDKSKKAEEAQATIKKLQDELAGVKGKLKVRRRLCVGLKEKLASTEETLATKEAILTEVESKLAVAMAAFADDAEEKELAPLAAEVPASSVARPATPDASAKKSDSTQAQVTRVLAKRSPLSVRRQDQAQAPQPSRIIIPPTKGFSSRAAAYVNNPSKLLSPASAFQPIAAKPLLASPQNLQFPPVLKK